MPHPVHNILAASAAVIFAFAAVPLLAQTGAGLLQGVAAFGDWHTDRPGTRRLIRPQDLPAPNTADPPTTMAFRASRLSVLPPCAIEPSFVMELAQLRGADRARRRAS